jgi:hypothetical protein
MPLESAAEVLLRFLLEIIVYALGYGTGWLLVPALSFGYYTVEPLSPPRRGTRRTRASGARPARQWSAEATAMMGVGFWVIVIALGFVIL